MYNIILDTIKALKDTIPNILNEDVINKESVIQLYLGPGTYNITAKQCRRTKLMYNFGYPKLVDTIEMLCVPIPSDYCHKCKTLCDGDYWQKDHTLFLCHLCWMEERATREIYTEKELKQFKKIRDCRYMHSHEGTTAKIHLLTPNNLKKKTRLENYLSLYLKC